MLHIRLNYEHLSSESCWMLLNEYWSMTHTFYKHSSLNDEKQAHNPSVQQPEELLLEHHLKHQNFKCCVNLKLKLLLNFLNDEFVFISFLFFRDSCWLSGAKHRSCLFFGFSTVVLKSFIWLASSEGQIFYMIKCSKLITAQNAMRNFFLCLLMNLFQLFIFFKLSTLKTSLKLGEINAPESSWHLSISFETTLELCVIYFESWTAQNGFHQK